MKNLRIFFTFITIFALTALGTTVFAQQHSTPLEVDVDLTVDALTVIDASACDPIDLGTLSVHSGTIQTCTIEAYSNNAAGFTISLYGTNNGFENTINPSFEWDKLSTSTGTMDTTCTSSCTEAWGWRIANGTASEYDLVEDDLNNNQDSFDAATTWHTVNYQSFGSPSGPETFITNTSFVDASAEFDFQLGALAGNTDAGSYGDTLTFTITAT